MESSNDPKTSLGHVEIIAPYSAYRGQVGVVTERYWDSIRVKVSGWKAPLRFMKREVREIATSG